MIEETELEFVKASDVKTERPPCEGDVPVDYPWPDGIGHVFSNGEETISTTYNFGTGNVTCRRGIVDSLGNAVGFSSSEERRFWLYSNGFKPVGQMTGIKFRRAK